MELHAITAMRFARRKPCSLRISAATVQLTAETAKHATPARRMELFARRLTELHAIIAMRFARHKPCRLRITAATVQLTAETAKAAMRARRTE